ncbi:MAG TPA: peptidoglycan-binding protein [Xanthobacteraceae bacterium]|nr:peptidoglycan-binding protein [Xanthobacteraceae bacterium]
MPSTVRPGRGAASPVDSDLATSRWRVLAAMGWNFRDAVGSCVAIILGGTILTNVLFMQTGQHPAPLFRSELAASVPPSTNVAPANPPAAKPSAANPSATSPPAAKETPVASVPSARPPNAPTQKAEPVPPARLGAEIVADIQRELARRGYYEGVIDGRYGPRTIAAIRDFEQTAGMKPSAEPSEILLQSIRRSSTKPSRPATIVSTGVVPPRPAPQPARNDAIATALAPSKRVLTVQRVLSDYGYGQIKPTGVVDADTQIAIERFERERKLPVTGQPSDRVVRELSAIVGRPLE